MATSKWQSGGITEGLSAVALEAKRAGDFGFSAAELDGLLTRVSQPTDKVAHLLHRATFGVRAGELVRLPLLLNDHDPNRKDVLSIVPGAVLALAAARRRD